MDEPLPEWRNVYRHFIDLGADAVIASHPHVPQGWEMYKGRLIAYSLGNFCFQKAKKVPKHWNEGLCCILEGEKNKGYHVEMRSICYMPRKEYICDNRDEAFALHMEQLNRRLADDKAYMEQVNAQVLALLGNYMGLFSRSGWFSRHLCKHTLKGIAEGFDVKHAFNNIACESHRWAILRALRLRANL